MPKLSLLEWNSISMIQTRRNNFEYPSFRLDPPMPSQGRMSRQLSVPHRQKRLECNFSVSSLYIKSVIISIKCTINVNLDYKNIKPAYS
jgi:hypothetical protein